MAKTMMSCMKGLFLIFNFVFWISGLALLVCGILAKFAFNYLLKLSTDINYDLAPYIMIGCGVFVILVGFIGCWAALKEHGWALKIYMSILLILVIVEIGGAIAGYVMKDKISSGLSNGLTDAVTNYYKDEDLKEAMDKIQKDIVKCCGVHTYKDYKLTVTNSTGSSLTNTSTANTTTASPTTTYKVPKSCCIKEQGCKYNQPINDNTPDTGFYEMGCYNDIVSATKDKFKIFGGVALGIAVFQILGIACGFLLTRQFSGSNYESM